MRTLGSSHCQKALKFFSLPEFPLENLRVQLEELQLFEFDLQNAKDSTSKLKISHQAVRLAFDCDECLKVIEQRRIQGDPDDYNESFPQEILRLVNMIQTFLKERLKILKTTREEEKQMFSIVLRVNSTSPSLPADLFEAIEKMRKLFN